MYLRRCLDSVENQTYDNFEVIMIDDGSTDESVKICDEYAMKHHNFYVIHEKNRGSSLARRYGIEKANGEWLAFVDADDDVHPEYIEKLYKACIKYNVKIATCDMQRIGVDDKPSAISFSSTQLLNYESLMKHFFNYDFWGFWGKIYRKTIFENIYYPPYNINEDYVVMAQLFEKCETVAYNPCPLYYYRNNPQGQSNSKLTQHIMDEYYNKLWVSNFYKKNDKKYFPFAQSQLTETVIKLNNIIKRYDREHDFKQQQVLLKKYLRINALSIIFSKNLLLGLKMEAIRSMLGL